MKFPQRLYADLKQTEFSPVFIGAIMLAFAAFQNMYPLVYPDTGSYILTGLESRVPVDRPLLYGLFLRHTSMRATMWFALFAQALIVSTILFAFVKSFFSNGRYRTIYYLLLAPLVTCTALSIKTSTLIPDAFTPLLILCFFILKNSNTLLLHRIWFASLMIFCLGVHQSHLMILIGTYILYAIYMLFTAGIKPLLHQTLKLKFMIPIFIISFFLTPVINVIYSGKFFWSKSGGIFMMGRLADNGLLQTYLQENCDHENLQLCQYKDKIPGDFLWDSSSPLHQMGGWDNPSPEYDHITHQIITTPKYLVQFSFKSLSASLVQFFSYQITVRAENAPMGFDSPPHYALRHVFKHEIGMYTSANQNIGRLDYTAIDQRQSWFLAITLVLFALVQLSSLRHHIAMFNKVLLLVTLFALSNAIVCGTLSIPNPRYQTRVFWLIPLVMLMALVYLLVKHRKEIVSHLRGHNTID